ncbi:hypothetical protein Trydic_g14082 [Trypoxylus dichotomus]
MYVRNGKKIYTLCRTNEISHFIFDSGPDIPITSENVCSCSDRKLSPPLINFPILSAVLKYRRTLEICSRERLLNRSFRCRIYERKFSLSKKEWEDITEGMALRNGHSSSQGGQTRRTSFGESNSEYGGYRMTVIDDPEGEKELPARSLAGAYDPLEPKHPTSVKRPKEGKMTYYYNGSAKDMKQLEEGQSVTVRNMDTNKWEAAQVVRNFDTPRSYIVRTNDREYRRNRIHLRESRQEPLSSVLIILRSNHIQSEYYR